MGIPHTPDCILCLSSCHHAPLKIVWLHHLYTFPAVSSQSLRWNPLSSLSHPHLHHMCHSSNHLGQSPAHLCLSSIGVLETGQSPLDWVSQVLVKGGKNQCPWSAGHTLANAAQGAVHVVAYQHLLIYKAAFQPVVLWPVIVPGVIPLLCTEKQINKNSTALIPEILLFPRVQAALSGILAEQFPEYVSSFTKQPG